MSTLPGTRSNSIEDGERTADSVHAYITMDSFTNDQREFVNNHTHSDIAKAANVCKAARQYLRNNPGIDSIRFGGMVFDAWIEFPERPEYAVITAGHGHRTIVAERDKYAVCCMRAVCYCA